MKFVLLIAVFCVVPCAFQDVWDDYDTWYDDLNNLADSLVDNADKHEDDPVQAPKPENDDNIEFHAADYDSEENYRDYEIEDNRDEVKNELEKEKEQEINEDPEQIDDNVESAVQDFDAFQQIINNDKLSEDVIDKILDVDDKSQMDLSVLLQDELPESDVENADAIPEKAFDDETIFQENNESQQVEEEVVEKNDEVKKDEQGVQSDIQEIRDETQNLLKELSSAFDEFASDDTQDIPEANAQPNLQDIVDETRQIIEDTNDNFDENEDTKEGEQNADVPVGDIEDDMKYIIDETQQILEKTNSEFDENKDAVKEQPTDDLESDMKNIIDETRQILEETNSDFDENKTKEDDQQNVEEAVQDIPELVVEENSVNEDTVDKVYADLNEDLDKLFETWKKLSLDDDVDENPSKVEDVKAEENADDALNRDYANIGNDEKNLDFDYEGEARILAFRQDYYDSIKDKDLSEIFNDFENDNADDDKLVENKSDEKAEETAPILYGNDAIAAESKENKEENSDKANVELSDEKEDENTENKDAQSVPTKAVNDLTSSELDELSQQFVMLHDSEIKMARDDTPVHITLTAEEPVVISSPNYPSAYPTDQTVVDWVLEGLGTGIELNLTDLEINSAQGHFLMIKPGQSDASGDSGIVFAYRINSDRRYRFRDVNKVFVRFNPLGGMSFSRGFQLSARMIEPPAGDSSQEDIPEPEFLLPAPVHTATLLLAGVNSTEFLELKDEFQRLLADMATMYINANNIDPGMNTTAVVTQITRTYVCNVNWPEFDTCVEVTFGVPLIYEDDEVPSRLTEAELMEMWDIYASRDPFATRLRQMGISDYSVPQEARIMTLWVVVGVGVVIAATMLAFALWRYSCIENYTRMPEFSDTDSIHDKKRGLDMYPTPHQTLPPLYSENDYKWADRAFDDSTRVDMGGYANNTFARDETSESEDDIVVSRDRNSFKPRDFGAV